MKCKKTYDSVLMALWDCKPPCHTKKECSENCPFFPYLKTVDLFDLSCAGFYVDYPKQAAKILSVEIIEEDNDENE